MLLLGPVYHHMLHACIGEIKRGKREVLFVLAIVLDAISELRQGILSIIEMALQRSLLHLLEAECHDAVMDAAFDHAVANVQASRAARAVVVDVEDWHPGDAYLVKCPLAAAGVPVDVTAADLLDF